MRRRECLGSRGGQAAQAAAFVEEMELGGRDSRVGLEVAVAVLVQGANVEASPPPKKKNNASLEESIKIG